MSETDVKKVAPKRWKNWLLILSLALNLAFIGMIIGFALREQKAPMPKMPVDLVRDLVRAMPEGHRQELREDLRSRRDEMIAMRSAIMKKRQDVITALDTPEFDITHIVEILDAHRVVISRVASGGQEMVVRRIELMSPRDRQVYAENLRKREYLYRQKRQ